MMARESALSSKLDLGSLCASGQYDYEIMDYTIRVLRKCKEYGFWVYMDPHQDIVRTSL